MELTNFFVRPCACSDADALWNIDCAASPFPWSRQAIVEELANDCGLHLVAQITPEAISGFIFSSVVAAELDIRNIATHPDMKRRGVARRLMEEAFKLARSRGAIDAYLEVRSKNEAALGLYQSLGFGVQSVRKHYYSVDGDDALVMHRGI
jgi:[ribosomal protein S18]-alanine N-acetyltransferase